MSKDRHTNRGGHNKIDLTGKTIGKLKVIGDSGKRKSRRPIWSCRCACGNEVEILGKYLLNGDTKSCGCIAKGNSHNRTGYKTLGGSYWYVVVAQAKRRGIPFSISAKQAYKQMERQGWTCSLTKEPLSFALNLRDSKGGQTASLDRIDNTKGYVKGNIQWVHKVINLMRNKHSVSDFVSWCKKVVENNP